MKQETTAKNSRRRKTGNVLIVLGLVLLLGAAGLTAYNIWDGIRAARESEQIIGKMDEILPDGLRAPDDAQNALQRIGGQDLTMPTEEIDGYEYIGKLIIPSLDLELPVMKEWDYTRLKISPCRYSGNYKTDDMVICAHNYARHFSPIKSIGIGAEVDFLTVDGVLYEYTVSNRETLAPTSVEEMMNNENNSESLADWDLTLFTCNTGGQTRCAVRCERTKE